MTQQHGPLARTAAEMMGAVEGGDDELKALRAWREPRGSEARQAKTRQRSLSSFLNSDPRELLDEPSELIQVDLLLAAWGKRRIKVLRNDPRIVMPKQLTVTIDDFAVHPLRGDNVREAVSIAIDSIDPVSWGASSEIRTELWRTERRLPVGPELTEITPS